MCRSSGADCFFSFLTFCYKHLAPNGAKTVRIFLTRRLLLDPRFV